ncbi:MAG: hypothetical protein Q9164_004969 [Protoblastenia rupestris]
MSEHEDEESFLGSSNSKEAAWHIRRHGRYRPPRDPRCRIVVGLVMILAFLLALSFWIIFPTRTGGFSLLEGSSCDTTDEGYQCDPTLSHSWGQYSPYYALNSEIPAKVPDGCKVTFVQLLSRHGARYPTLDKSRRYNDTISKIQSTIPQFSGPYAFLQRYVYGLGADDLTAFGQQEMFSSGIDFFSRYEVLSMKNMPFIRASGQDRVVKSAQKWMEGFQKTKIESGAANDTDYPYPITVISEEAGMNNTLNHGNCPVFEASETGVEAQEAFDATFLPAITARLSSALGPEAKLTDADTIALMDMCPFTVVAGSTFPSSNKASTTTKTPTSNDPKTNPFCALFSPTTWQDYSYHQTLQKHYAYGPGSPLGPTQGVGFVQELIARLTSTPIPYTSTTGSINRTLDSNPTTFPLDKALYADFSHDNDMTSIFAALSLFSHTPQLNLKEVMSTEEMGGYSASRTVPFAGRMVVEKLQCQNDDDEMVRVIVNGRVLPFESCGGDERGLCTIGAFLDSLEFARSGGRWDECFNANTEVKAQDRLTVARPAVDIETERR